MAAMELTRTHRILIGVVVAGAVVIAGIGFAGSYSAVRTLALQKGFGSFSLVFPIGIDAGICVLLALDLLLTWMRIPFPLLRQTAWLLTAATIAFNGAASWPDPLGVGMHAVIPILFVVTVEAARHAVGRIADITADRHMEGVRITRWVLSPIPTFKLWRRMKLWELRSYEQAVAMEQDRLIYQARLQARYGRAWRRKAPVAALMPLRLARIGVPLAHTAPEGLAAAGIDPALLAPAQQSAASATYAASATPAVTPAGSAPALETAAAHAQAQAEAQSQAQTEAQAQAQQGQPGQQLQPQLPETSAQAAAAAAAAHAPPPFAVDPTAMPAAHNSAWFAAPLAPQAAYEGGYNPQYVEGLEPIPVMPPTGPEEPRQQSPQPDLPIPGPRQDAPAVSGAPEAAAAPAAPAAPEPVEPAQSPDEAEFADIAYKVFVALVDEQSDFPTPEALDIHLSDGYGVTHPRSGSLLRRMIPAFKQRYQKELEAEHIA
ncbi:DUF2637 domain-containing protein [Streptomyces antarcticus]|uniref:DUF2637 domain-containing protein n=1 Tax=Streptomyces antarcticus TaxID=2996458 RepID=UPI002270CCC5|nr:MULTISPECIES: DUF2637 domain-containing protein [unclassified Streptomyces]MCY0947547.1 DUF2637 domain-containing protein [Streptomyces sp. H34-AA3]MCZ4087175.1 DUF2637 domain-containing protein [Streptomyces sp. H34-S5]